MKQKALKVLSLTMALNILFSTMGMAFYEHTCLITTIKTISISSEDFCCEEDAGISSDNEGLTQLKQGSCCETTKVLKKTLLFLCRPGAALGPNSSVFSTETQRAWVFEGFIF